MISPYSPFGIIALVVAVICSEIEGYWRIVDDTYCPLLDFSNNPICFRDQPDSSTDCTSYTSCALQCYTSPSCIFFQYNEGNQECQLFRHISKMKNLPGNNCSSYALRDKLMIVLSMKTVKASECQLPFTHNGKLYKKCLPIYQEEQRPCELFWCKSPNNYSLKYCIPDVDSLKTKDKMVDCFPTPKCPFTPVMIQNFVVIFSRNFSSTLQKWEDTSGQFNSTAQMDRDGNYWIGQGNIEMLSWKKLKLRIEVQLMSSVWVSEGYSSVQFITNKIVVGSLAYSDFPVQSIMTKFNDRRFRCSCQDPKTNSCWWHNCDSLDGVLTADGDIWPYNSSTKGNLKWARMMVSW